MSCDDRPDRRGHVGHLRFNRPKAISCLATTANVLSFLAGLIGFNRPKAISCLATTCCSPAIGASKPPSCACFNRPKAISCLATNRRSIIGDFTMGFNRPKAISCLATFGPLLAWEKLQDVSIARRRLVVLRLLFSAGASRQTIQFQSPEGD